MFAFEKVNLRGYIVAGEWGQMKFETENGENLKRKMGNKAKFIKRAQTSHICPSPRLKSNQIVICGFYPTAVASPHLSGTICILHQKH